MASSVVAEAGDRTVAVHIIADQEGEEQPETKGKSSTSQAQLSKDVLPSKQGQTIPFHIRHFTVKP